MPVQISMCVYFLSLYDIWQADLVCPYEICDELSSSFSLIYSKSQNMVVREVTGYKLYSPCSNHGEVFGLLKFIYYFIYLSPPYCNAETFLDSSSFCPAGYRWHVLHFKESCFLRCLNVWMSLQPEQLRWPSTYSLLQHMARWRIKWMTYKHYSWNADVPSFTSTALCNITFYCWMCGTAVLISP
jgi:hypothetical protein